MKRLVGAGQGVAIVPAMATGRRTHEVSAGGAGGRPLEEGVVWATRAANQRDPEVDHLIAGQDARAVGLQTSTRTCGIMRRTRMVATTGHSIALWLSRLSEDVRSAPAARRNRGPFQRSCSTSFQEALACETPEASLAECECVEDGGMGTRGETEADRREYSQQMGKDSPGGNWHRHRWCTACDHVRTQSHHAVPRSQRADHGALEASASYSSFTNDPAVFGRRRSPSHPDPEALANARRSSPRLSVR